MVRGDLSCGNSLRLNSPGLRVFCGWIRSEVITVALKTQIWHHFHKSRGAPSFPQPLLPSAMSDSAHREGRQKFCRPARLRVPDGRPLACPPPPPPLPEACWPHPVLQHPDRLLAPFPRTQGASPCPTSPLPSCTARPHIVEAGKKSQGSD